MILKIPFLAALLALCTAGTVGKASAADISVLTAGAFRPVLDALEPSIERSAGLHLIITNGTAGELAKRIQNGEAFDVAILPEPLAKTLSASGNLAPTLSSVARVGIGVAVPEGAPRPDISTVEQFKQTLLAAPSVAYLDPTAGGSSGVYLSKLFETLGIAQAIAPKAVLVHGGLVGTRLVDGQAALAVHQISELLAVPRIQYVGPLPAAVQNYTVYAVGVSAHAKNLADAQKLIQALHGKEASALLKPKGMEPAASQ
ncbi:substrate-binding domain-containing protein [Ralstonia pickettii]|uniref:substrate-binding domain-containing protein n=1 Tax=Ralstonia pickettii TaxID=329 RepID=UPI0027155959|nr:substrate-binding domain-containing protein [Ralstonia pickettii]MEC8850057.1 substrate-binding domain-containing protein [Pseudomonadota bacterium]WKZ88074.1 substrate-binding domain-containing protein [Ralstonia pickettii]